MKNCIAIPNYTLPSVTATGLFKVEKPYIHRYRHVNVHTILFIVKGELYVKEDNIDYEVPSNNIFFFKSGCKQVGTKLIPPGTMWYWVNFHYNDVNIKNEDLVWLPKTLSVSNQNDILNYFIKMENIYHSIVSYKNQRLNGYLYQLIYELLSLNKYNNETSDINRISPKVIRILRSQLEGRFSSDKISEELGMNYSYLGRLFKQETGTTINHYYLKLKINLAIQLFQTTNLNISEISERLHYPNPYYFSKVFKQITGMSPKEYQKQLYR